MPHAQLDFDTHLRAESARFLDVLADCDPAARVPTCPDWTAADLLWHLGEVQWFWGSLVDGQLKAPDSLQDPERPAGWAQLVEFFRSSHAVLTGALGRLGDDVPVWTWYAPDQSVGFVRRRQAHEALIHRLDAELTAGTVTDVDTELAADGVAEALEWMYGDHPAWAEAELTGAVGRVATTDTGHEWLVRLGRWSGTSPNTGKEYAGESYLSLVESGPPAFSVVGAARDLDAWLWNRPTITEVGVDGDADAFVALIRAGVQ